MFRDHAGFPELRKAVEAYEDTRKQMLVSNECFENSAYTTVSLATAASAVRDLNAACTSHGHRGVAGDGSARHGPPSPRDLES